MTTQEYLKTIKRIDLYKTYVKPYIIEDKPIDDGRVWVFWTIFLTTVASLVILAAK